MFAAVVVGFLAGCLDAVIRAVWPRCDRVQVVAIRTIGDAIAAAREIARDCNSIGSSAEN